MHVTEYEVGAGAYGVAIAADGAVWTSLVHRGELARLGPDGQVSRIPLDSERSRPMVLASGPDEAIWFSRGDGQLGRVDPDGTVSATPVLTPDGSPYGICVGADGGIWYTVLGTDRIGRLAPDGQHEEFPLASGSMPSLIASGPDQAMWFTLNQAHAIGRITPDGRISIYPLPTPDAAPVGIDAVRAAGEDADGDSLPAAWFAEIGAGQLGRVWPDGRIEEIELPDRSCGPHAVVATPDGGCWASLWASSALVRVDHDGRLRETVPLRPAAEPHGLALAPDGTVWVALEAGFLAQVTG